MVDERLFKKWKKQYIDNVDLSNIEYLDLSPEELRQFLYENYLDQSSWTYVSSEKFAARPIGLVYLDYDFFDLKNPYEKNKRFLIGVVKNNINKKTIVSIFKYSSEYYFFKEQKIPLTYIMSVEVNNYFRNKGLFKQLVNESLNHINLEYPVIITLESEMGHLVGTHNIIKTIYRQNGFDKDIRSIGECTEEYEEYLMGAKSLTK